MIFVPYPPRKRGGGPRNPALLGVAAALGVGVAVALKGGAAKGAAPDGIAGGTATGLSPWILMAILVLAAVGTGVRWWQRSSDTRGNTSHDEADRDRGDRSGEEDALPIWKLIGLGLVLAGLVLLLLFGLRPAQAQAQSPSPRDTVTFVLTRGVDTLAVERVTRAVGTLTGEITARGQPRIVLTLSTSATDSVREARFAVFGPTAGPDATPLQRGSVRFEGDSARVEMTAGGGAAQQLTRPAPRGSLVLASNAFGALELVIARLARSGRDSTGVTFFSMAGATVIEGSIARLGRDSVRIRFGPQEVRARVSPDGRLLGARYATGDFLVSRLEGGAGTPLRVGRVDYGAPPGAPYRAEEVVVRTAAGHALSGTLTVPAEAGGRRVPAVVTITGSGQSDRDEAILAVPGYRPFRQLADTLGRRGVAVLRLDDRGVGGSGGDPKGTSADFADDIRSAIAFLRSRPDIDAARIGLVGHSEGGMIAPMVAATDPTLAGIVLLAGQAWTGRQVIHSQQDSAIAMMTNRDPQRTDSLRRVSRAALDSMAGQDRWLGFFLQHDPLAVARRVTVPVLIAHGASDQQVTVAQAAQLATAFREGGNRRVEVRVFPALNHLFQRDPSGAPGNYARLPARVEPEVLGAVADWLATTLRAGQR